MWARIELREEALPALWALTEEVLAPFVALTRLENLCWGCQGPMAGQAESFAHAVTHLPQSWQGGFPLASAASPQQAQLQTTDLSSTALMYYTTPQVLSCNPMLSQRLYSVNPSYTPEISQGTIASNTKKPQTSYQTSVALRAKVQHTRMLPVSSHLVETPKLVGAFRKTVRIT